MNKLMAFLIVLMLSAAFSFAAEDLDTNADTGDSEEGTSSVDDSSTDNVPEENPTENNKEQSEDDLSPDSESFDDSSQKYEQEFSKVIGEDIYDDIDDVALEGDGGLTPDSSFYFLEDIVETVLVGDNPETALEYKEEKVLELRQMVNSGNQGAAEKALERVEKYNKIIKKEVSPDIEKKVRESSKAVKSVLEGLDLEGDNWDDVRDAVDDNLKEEDKIALAAKISKKISQLCKALSGLDPLEYSKVCSTGDDDPKWKRDLDRKLTAEQRREAEAFFAVMSQCFQNPAECRCDDISVKQFADQCNIIAPLAAECMEGKKQSCEEMEKVPDPIDLLPDYLQDVMEDVEDRYSESKHDLHVPKECADAGATSRDTCFKVMFKLNAPPECQEALEAGKIDPKNEREARKACEDTMFTANAPPECIEAGLRDHRECERFMFKLDAPQECLDAGLTGSGRDDWKKCQAIRFKLDAPQECLDAGIDGTGRDDWRKCDAIRFKLDAPPECINAGLDGTGRDDWKKCEKIRFLLDAPEECHQFADQRDPWKACQPIQFKQNAAPECLEAGLDGTGRDDWRKCEQINFKANAAPECLEAGLDGSGRNDWRKCDEIRKNLEPSQGEDPEGRGGAQWGRREREPDEHEFPSGDGEQDEGSQGDFSEDNCRKCAQQCDGQRWACQNGQCVCSDESPRGDIPSVPMLPPPEQGDDHDEVPFPPQDHPSEDGSDNDERGRDPEPSGDDSSDRESSEGSSSESGSSDDSSGSESGSSGSGSPESSSVSSNDESGSEITGSAIGIFEGSSTPEKSFRELRKFVTVQYSEAWGAS